MLYGSWKLVSSEAIYSIVEKENEKFTRRLNLLSLLFLDRKWVNHNPWAQKKSFGWFELSTWTVIFYLTNQREK